MFWSRSLLRCAPSRVPSIIMLRQARSLRLLPSLLSISGHIRSAKQTPTLSPWVPVLRARFKSSKPNSSKSFPKASFNISPKDPSQIEHVPTAALHEGVLSATDGRRHPVNDTEKTSPKYDIRDQEQELADLTKRIGIAHDRLHVVYRRLGRKKFNQRHLAQALHAYISVMNSLLPDLERDVEQISVREQKALGAFIRDPHRSLQAKVLHGTSGRPTEHRLNEYAKLVEDSRIHGKVRWSREFARELRPMLYAACVELENHLQRYPASVPRWLELALKVLSGTKWDPDAGYALYQELDSMSSPPTPNTQLSSPRRR